MVEPVGGNEFWKLMARLKTFIKLSGTRRKLFFRACYELLRAGIVLKSRPFNQHANGFGIKKPGDQIIPDILISQEVRDVRWAINLANRVMGDKFSCLMIALAGKAMLNDIGVSNTLVLGAAPGAAGAEMQAHAWLRVGDVVVFGEEEMHKYSALLSFVDDHKSANQQTPAL